MTLRRWEAVVAVGGVALAWVFVFSNTSEVGWALMAADALWVLTRVEIRERHDQAGWYTTLRGCLGATKLLLLAVIYGAALYGFFVIRHDLGTQTRPGLIADFALAGLCFMLIGEFRRSGDETINWINGARAERAVGFITDEFKKRGWFTAHGYKKDWGGDIDHILCGPTGAYVIETKSYGFRPRDLRQARTNAWWLRGRLGIPWVTGVLCVEEDRAPEERDKVWVVGRIHLQGFLERQRHVGIDPDVARELLAAPSSTSPASASRPRWWRRARSSPERSASW